MKASLLFLAYVFIYQEFVHAQEATGDRPVINPLALGGMVQGLLDMQSSAIFVVFLSTNHRSWKSARPMNALLILAKIRPQGGFYEDRYKDIFPDSVNVPLATTNHLDRRHAVSNSLTNRDIVSEDGRSLTEAISGNSPNPCFDSERISRNPLLLLVCSLQSLNMQPSENDV